jgi:hypothetical protein
MSDRPEINSGRQFGFNPQHRADTGLELARGPADALLFCQRGLHGGEFIDVAVLGGRPPKLACD